MVVAIAVYALLRPWHSSTRHAWALEIHRLRPSLTGA